MKFAVWGHMESDLSGDASQVEQAFGYLREAGIDILLLFGKDEFAPVLKDGPEAERFRLVLQAAKAHNVEVHPEICPYSLAAYLKDFGECEVSEIIKGRAADGSPRRVTYLCPSWPGHVKLSRMLIGKLLSDYEIDGIQLDGVRYPQWIMCTCSRCKANRQKWLDPDPRGGEWFKKLASFDGDGENHPHGVPGFEYLRIKERVTLVGGLMAEVSELCRSHGKLVSVAARSCYMGNAIAEGQDWVAWCEAGLLDFISPMSYTKSVESLCGLMDHHRRLISGCVPIYHGVARWWSGGKNTPSQMMSQIEHVRDNGGEGVTIFRLGGLGEEDFEKLKAFKKNTR